MFKHKFQNIEMISNKKYVSSRKIIIFFYGLGCTSNDVEFLLKRKFLSRFQLIIFDLNHLFYRYFLFMICFLLIAQFF